MKFLPRGVVTDGMLRRFWREAQTAASIKHPNVVSIHDVGQQEHLHYIVMEYVEGRTLTDFCRDEMAHRPDRVFPWPLAYHLIIPVLDALCAVHGRGLVHRDVKPSNIMVTSAPLSAGGMHVVLMDFGLVQDESDADLTESGGVVGTPAYMAPEQALGKRTDERSDIFAVGATLYYMLSGRHPHVGSKTVVLARAAMGFSPIPLAKLRPDIPPDVCRVVERAMSARASQRYAGAREMLLELKRSLEAGPHLEATVSHQPKRLATAAETPASGLLDTDPRSGSRGRLPNRAGGVPRIAAAMPPNRPWAQIPFLPAMPKTALWGGALLLGFIVWLGFVVWVGRLITGRPAPESARTSESHQETVPATPSTSQSDSTVPREPTIRDRMVFIPAGTVQLGASETRLRNHAATLRLFRNRPDLIDQFVQLCRDEPNEVVSVSSFWIDQYEVTNAQYAEFVRATRHSPPRHWTSGQPPAGKEDHPVTHVRYADAAAYASWAGKQLPTIAQWTRAFRGDDDRMYPWGDSWFNDRANVVENVAFPRGTSSVQSTPRDVSPFGVFNLAGHVSEILRNRTTRNGIPTTITKGAHSEANGPIYAAAPFRFLLVGDDITAPLVGFRCVREED